MGYYDPPDVREGSYNMTCKGYMPEDCRAVPVWLISSLRPEGALLMDTVTVEQLNKIALEMLDMPKAVDVECGYEGGVDAQFSGGKTSYVAYWTCPRCGTEGEEDREVGDDDPRL